MTLTFRRADGSTRRVSGYRYAAPRPGTRTWLARAAAAELPRRVDLRPFLSPVEDQRTTSSCAANAVAGAYEYLVRRHLGEDGYDVSRLFIYYNGRAVDGVEGEDGGSVIGSLIEALRELGACSEETWPFDEARVNEEPSDEAYQEAAHFLVEDNALVATDLDAWRAVLAEGYPIVFGIALFESFDRQRRPGLVPMPSPDEVAREEHSGHAMLAVGYSDRDRVFIVRNSWGERWGDRGYCYIPYDYLMSPEHNRGDSWIVRRIQPVQGGEGWSDDEASILPDVDGELAGMTDDELAALVHACGEVPFEARLAHLFLLLAGADDDVSDEELGALAARLEDTLERLGSDLDAEAVLRFAGRHAEDEDLGLETIALFAEHLSPAFLATVITQAHEIAAADELSEGERELLERLIEAWQIEG
jgi:uncharacterized tellurite resistance protein B-like protein